MSDVWEQQTWHFGWHGHFPILQTQWGVDSGHADGTVFQFGS